MPVKARTKLAFRQINPLIGAEILAAKDALLDGEHAPYLRELLEERGVLVFPKVDFTEAEQVAFTKRLASSRPTGSRTGPRSSASIPPPPRPRRLSRARGSGISMAIWTDVPILASIMCAKVLASEGGDTEFANSYAAYEALPEERRQQIAGLEAVHAIAAAQLSIVPEPSYEEFAEWRRIPSSTLPLVWRHRSGRKSLVIGNSAANIIGMDPLEGLDLLVWLRDWVTQDRFTYRHVWSAGDAVMWDNTGTLHRATAYTADSGRLMFRTKLAGEEPFA